MIFLNHTQDDKIVAKYAYEFIKFSGYGIHLLMTRIHKIVCLRKAKRLDTAQR